MISGSLLITDTATPTLLRVRSQVQRPRAMMAAAGKRAEREYRAHFLKLDRRGNAKGWPSAHFWARIRNSTAFTGATDTTADVTVAEPAFAQKVFGGTIRAKRGKFIALPTTARAKAAGSPREGGIPDLFVIGRRGGKGLYLAIKEGGVIRVQYRLLTSVTQRPDPDALIADDKLAAALDDEAKKFWDRELRRLAR